MSQLTVKPLPGTVSNPLYPDSDGQPMGETDFHVAASIWLREALQDFFAEQADVYVASNMLLYYEEGNPSGRRDPDLLVARGVGKHLRRSFRTWEENTVPNVLFEISSEGTWREDLGAKREVYTRLGVAEYFLFDPEGLYLDPRLQGFRLRGGLSVPIPPDADGGLTSEQLGLRLVPEGPMLRVLDARTGMPVPTRAEQLEQARERTEEEQRRADEEQRRADELAAEVARLRALLAERRNHESHESNE
jgi:Uma2 family endonuclease